MPAYSGFWDGHYNSPYPTNTANLPVARSPQFRRISQALRRRALTKLREVLDTVADSASINGASAVTRKRIVNGTRLGDPVTGGGVRTIEDVTVIAASSSVGTSVVSAAQVDELVDFRSRPATYAKDKSGNGSGYTARQW